MTLIFNPTTYGSLLADIVPKVVETEEEYDRLLVQFERLHVKKKNRTSEELSLYRRLVVLIETYEEHQFCVPASFPHEMLQYIMECSGTRQVGLLGSSGVVSEIVNGKRAMSKAQAKTLGDRFKVSPSLFI